MDELFGEKIDITTWDDDPHVLIKNVLSPAKVEKVLIDDEEKAATVVVPDYQLSLAIGKEGQNVRLAAKLCGWKIDIKSHTQFFEGPEYMEEVVVYEDEDYEEYDDDVQDMTDEPAAVDTVDPESGEADNTDDADEPGSVEDTEEAREITEDETVEEIEAADESNDIENTDADDADRGDDIEK